MKADIFNLTRITYILVFGTIISARFTFGFKPNSFPKKMSIKKNEIP